MAFFGARQRGGDNDEHIISSVVLVLVSNLWGVPSVLCALEPSSDVYCVPSKRLSVVCVCV